MQSDSKIPELVQAVRELLVLFEVGSEEEPPSTSVWSPARGELVWGILSFEAQERLGELASALARIEEFEK